MEESNNNMKNTVSKMVSWLLLVVLFSILPLVIKSVLYFWADKNIFDDSESFMGELFFFTLIISADNFKSLTFDKLYETSKTLHILIFVASFLIATFAAILYGIVVINDILNIINIPFNPTKLRTTAIVVSIIGLVIGITIQILHIKFGKEGK